MPKTIVTRIALITAALAAASPATAANIVLQPDEATSEDVFIYEFNVPGVFGIPTAANVTNLDTATLSAIMPPPVPFGNFLGASETEPFELMPGSGLRQHTTRSLLRFDLAGIGFGADMLAGATLNLFALGALPAFESPSAMNPVTTDVRAVLEAWDEQVVTWETRPNVAATPSDSIMQSDVGIWISFDVTDLVGGWLTDPTSNFGVEISQRDIVAIPQAMGRDRFVASLYASSASADPTIRPFLSVASVPAPAPLAILAAGAVALGALRIRKA